MRKKLKIVLKYSECEIKKITCIDCICTIYDIKIQLIWAFLHSADHTYFVLKWTPELTNTFMLFGLLTNSVCLKYLIMGELLPGIIDKQMADFQNASSCDAEKILLHFVHKLFIWKH